MNWLYEKSSAFRFFLKVKINASSAQSELLGAGALKTGDRGRGVVETIEEKPECVEVIEKNSYPFKA